MPKNLTDVATFDDPVSVPVDTDARNAASVETPFQQLANRTEYLRSRVEVGQATAVNIPPKAGLQGEMGLSEWNQDSIVATDPNVLSQGNGSELIFDLSAYVPDGAVITDVEVMAVIGAARSLGSRTRVGLYVTTPSWVGSGTVLQTLYLSECSGGSGAEIFAITDGVNAPVGWPGGGLGIAKENFAYQLVVQAGVDGGGHVSDSIKAIRVSYTAPPAQH